jgi:hypothetical protein
VITASLLQAIGLQATPGPAVTQRVAHTEILDGSAGKAEPLIAWLQSYFGATVTPVPAPSSGPAVTVVLGSDYAAKTFAVR